MSKCMHKLVFSMTLFLLVALLSVAYADGSSIALTGYSSFDSANEVTATQFSIGVLYHGGNLNKYYKLTVPKDGEYVFYCKGSGDAWTNIYLYDQYQQEIFEAEDLYDFYDATIKKVSMKANRSYVVRIYSSSYSKFLFGICGDGKHLPLDAKTKTVEATCVNEGYSANVCPVCKDEYNVLTIDAKGHTPGEWKTETAATCENDGLLVQRCTVCNEKMSQESIPAFGHTEGEPSVVLEPTCLQQGILATQCTTCSKIMSKESIPITDHAPGVMSVAKPATCTEDGLNEQRCKVCNILLDLEITAAQGHKPGEWRETNDPSCTTVGIKAQECTVCSLRLGSEIVPAYGHTPGDWRVTIRSSAFSAGERVQNCDVCHEQIAVEEIPAAISKVLIFGLIASVGAALVMTILFVTKAKKNK